MTVSKDLSAVIDEAENEVCTVDPATGNKYVRLRQIISRGREKSREWFAPDGSTLCRLEASWDGRGPTITVTKGSLDAVQAQNPAYLPPDHRAEIESHMVN